MRKQRVLVTVLSAAAILSAGQAFTSMAAARGWVQQENEWVYLDSSGEPVTNEWKKKDGKWVYLDDDGFVSSSQWVEDSQYVDEKGNMVVNQWIYAEEDESPSGEEGWFYLNAKGKAVAEGWKNIGDDRYYFDSDGRMMTGWFYDDNDTYYLGDDGAMRTGWLALEFMEDRIPEEGEVSDSHEAASDDIKWFYFQGNGKAFKGTADEPLQRNIGGKKYYFDEHGVMMSGWVAVASPAEADKTGITRYKYLGEADDGVMEKGWKYLEEHPSSLADTKMVKGTKALPEDGEGYWYYFDKDGTPKFMDQNADSMTSLAHKIDGDYYFFDEYGCLQTGLIGFEKADGTMIAGYFGDEDSNGKMYTGRHTNVEEEDGSKYTYFFNNSGASRGAGVNGEKNGYLYSNGRLVTADDDSDYQVFKVDGKLYLVNESGKVQTSNKLYKSEGEYAYEYADGVIYRVNEEKERVEEITEGRALPEIAFDAVYKIGK